jgi:drug/metabolite transporter (DMT)-like permease
MNLSKSVQYMLGSTFCFSIMQALIKYLPEIHSFEHVFFRSLVTWLFCIFFLFWNKIPLKGKNTKLLLIRAGVGTISLFTFFYILPRIPFGTAVTLKYLAPVFTAILAIFMLGERLKWIQWTFLGMAMLGVCCLKGFDIRIGTFDLIIGLISAFANGLLYILIRQIGDDDHPLVVIHYFMLIASVISGCVSIPYWKTPDLHEAFIFFLIGLAGFVAQVLFTYSLRGTLDGAGAKQEDTSFLSMLRYAEVMFALIIGYLWFGESYTLQTFFGFILIFIALIGMIRFKTKQKKINLN